MQHLKFINEKIGKRPVVAVVFSHSHADHFGGVRGVVDEADVNSGKVKIIAPVGFMQHAVAENVYAGTAMSSAHVLSIWGAAEAQPIRTR